MASQLDVEKRRRRWNPLPIQVLAVAASAPSSLFLSHVVLSVELWKLCNIVEEGRSMLADDGSFLSRCKKKTSESIVEGDQDEVSMGENPLLSRHLTLLLGNGKAIDLLELFVHVKNRGGYFAVSRGGLWETVGEDQGLSYPGVGSTIKLPRCPDSEEEVKAECETAFHMAVKNSQFEARKVLLEPINDKIAVELLNAIECTQALNQKTAKGRRESQEEEKESDEEFRDVGAVFKSISRGLDKRPLFVSSLLEGVAHTTSLSPPMNLWAINMKLDLRCLKCRMCVYKSSDPVCWLMREYLFYYFTENHDSDN